MWSHMLSRELNLDRYGRWRQDHRLIISKVYGLSFNLFGCTATYLWVKGNKPPAHGRWTEVTKRWNSRTGGHRPAVGCGSQTLWVCDHSELLADDTNAIIHPRVRIDDFYASTWFTCWRRCTLALPCPYRADRVDRSHDSHFASTSWSSFALASYRTGRCPTLS
jgi:hypothetical protein